MKQYAGKRFPLRRGLCCLSVSFLSSLGRRKREATGRKKRPESNAGFRADVITMLLFGIEFSNNRGLSPISQLLLFLFPSDSSKPG